MPVTPTTFNVNTTQEYELRVTENNCTVKDTIVVNAIDLPTFNYQVTNETCFNSNNGIIDISNQSGTFTYGYILNSITTSNVTNPIQNLGGGNYQLLITDNITACSNNDSLIIIDGPTDTLAFDEQEVSTTPDVCDNDKGLIELLEEATGGTSPYTYSIDGTTFQSNLDFPDLPIATYQISIKDANGCTITTSSSYTISSGGNVIPSLPSFNEPIELCEGHELEIIDTISANAGLTHVYYFEPAINQDTSLNEIILTSNNLPQVETIYVFALSALGGCSGDTAEVDLNYVFKNEIINVDKTEICQGESIEIEIQDLNNNLDTIYWTVNDSSGFSQINPVVFAPAEIGWYVFKMPNSTCLFQDSVLIESSDDCETQNVVITNAFSPFGNIQENKVFKLDLAIIGPGEDVAVTIYNRWGDIIFNTDNYDNVEDVWDGTNQSGTEMMPEGTYFYVVESEKHGLTTSGWVYLDLNRN